MLFKSTFTTFIIIFTTCDDDETVAIARHKFNPFKVSKLMMAVEKVSELGGYDLDYPAEPPDALKCLICFSVAKDPWQHVSCGRLFCCTCLHEHRKENSKCPACRVKNGQYYPDRKSSREVDELRVRCGTGDGCQWEGPLGQYLAHSIKCPSRVVFCPKKCLKVDDKPYQCLLKDLESHLELDCPYRTSRCPHCQQEGTYKSLRGEHLEVCPFVLTKCPHPQCEAELSSCLLLFHLLTDCEHVPIKCKYSYLGCPITMPRREIAIHERDSAAHFPILTEAVTSLQSELTTAQRDICCLREERDDERMSQQNPTHNAVTFKLPELSSYNDKDFTFDKLYSHVNRQGYRFSIKILPNNDGYLSIYFFLMKGPHDDNLEWPFRGKISVELLNQARDDDHLKKTVELPRSHGQRVTDTEESKRGIGITEFITVRQLKSRGEQGRNKVRYLVDNCLYFRVTVLPRIRNAWLTCTN